jgi:hypothetical protein
MVKRGIIATLIFTVWIIWFLYLLRYAANQPQGSENAYSLMGAFGDSFGVIASLMATLAAIGVYLTYSAEAEARRIQHFESNFFALLRNFESITSQLSIRLTSSEHESELDFDYPELQDICARKTLEVFEGRRAIFVILLLIRERIGLHGYNNIKVVAKGYDYTYSYYAQNLGHYFRTLYHIYRLIEERCPGDKQYYGRIVRAQLSDSELCLLGYNFTVGEGREKFKSLAGKFSVMHNLHHAGLDAYARSELDFFLRKLPPEVFRFEERAPITYDD